MTTLEKHTIAIVIIILATVIILPMMACNDSGSRTDKKATPICLLGCK